MKSQARNKPRLYSARWLLDNAPRMICWVTRCWRHERIANNMVEFYTQIPKSHRRNLEFYYHFIAKASEKRRLERQGTRMLQSLME